MQLHSIPFKDILISKKRQRKEFKPEDVVSLAGSISQLGLLHPVIVRKDDEGNITLVAGERRLKAMNYIWGFGETVRCGEYSFNEGSVPCLYIGEVDPLDAFEMELEENIRRVDLAWQEKAEATALLLKARQERALRTGSPPPTIEDISREIRGTTPTSQQATRVEILVSKHLTDPEVQKAKSAGDAFKLLKRREELQRNADLAAKVGVTFSSQVHSLYQGDCREILPDLPKESFDVILTDPPYGIDSDKFSDSDGKAQGSHFYDDSWTYWNKLIQFLAVESFRLCKPQAHAYVFCDVDNFILLKSFFQEAGWRVFRTPLVWVNPTGQRAPWPQSGPQRKYQLCLYAIKGDRPVLQLKPDVLTWPSDENLNHQAQKPVNLYIDLLSRSVRPGDSVLDCFGGTGTVILAAHTLKCRATYVEMDQAAYGTAINRLKGLD